MRTQITCLLLLGSTALAVQAADSSNQWSFTPDPALPNVLILGDSISIGYGPPVRELLRGKANVFRPLNAAGTQPENCEGTTRGVKSIDRWLTGHKWAVIHFNFGLHDLKHVKQPGDSKISSDLNDPVQATVEQYAQNLEAIVQKLESTGAKLIFATTTPAPAGNSGRVPEDPPRYNEAALRIMQKHKVKVNDLYALVVPRSAELQLPKNVHFKPEGSKALAEQVAHAIEAELPKP